MELYACEYNYIVLYCNENNRDHFYSAVKISKIKVKRRQNLEKQRRTEEIDGQLIITNNKSITVFFFFFFIVCLVDDIANIVDKTAF